MSSQNFLILTALVIIVLVAIVMRWFLRKLRLRRAWAAINAEREQNKRAFAQLAVQVAQSARPGGVLPNTDFPVFPDQQWQALVANGTAAMIKPDQRREVEELYVDLDRLRSKMTELSSATGAAQSAEGGRGDEISGALRALIGEMHRFQPLHTDFDAVLPQ